MEPIYKYTGKFLNNWRLDLALTTETTHVYTGEMVYIENDKLPTRLMNKIYNTYRKLFYNLKSVNVYYDGQGGVTAIVELTEE